MSPRVNLPPALTLADVTIGELRAVLAAGNEGDTIADALAAITEAARVGAAHALDVREYQAYVDRRQARHAQALEAAAATVKVDPRVASADSWQRRQEARLEAAENFEIREPLLEFAAWIDLDRPEVYAGSAIRRALRAVTRQELVH